MHCCGHTKILLGISWLYEMNSSYHTDNTYVALSSCLTSKSNGYSSPGNRFTQIRLVNSNPKHRGKVNFAAIPVLTIKSLKFGTCHDNTDTVSCSDHFVTLGWEQNKSPSNFKKDEVMVSEMGFWWIEYLKCIRFSRMCPLNCNDTSMHTTHPTPKIA